MYTLREISLQYKPRLMQDQPKLNGSASAYEVLHRAWDPDMHICESFLVLHLGASNRLKGIQRVSKGGLTATMADIRLIYSAAMKALSTAIILAHNHPSCQLSPSHSDKILTKKVKEAGDILEVKVLDHLILSPEGGYYSFADEGLM